MKQSYSLLFVLCCAVLFSNGCGRKGDPAVPPIPEPLPIQDFSATVDASGVTLSWTPPTEYSNQKSMDLDDIRTFTIYRKTEIPETNSWNFSQTTEGWTSAGKTLPIKHHKGVLRAASEQNKLFIRSQEELSVSAGKNRYIRLKLWTKNAKEGYIAFITDDDEDWDIDADITFQPVVHTSFYAFQTTFNEIKLKPFKLETTPSDETQEYLIDMKTIPAWKGTIEQIGILLRDKTSELSDIELGLDTMEFSGTLEETASLYDTSPWVFLSDEEGWKRQTGERNFGTVSGVLYAGGTDTVALLSQPGQKISPKETGQMQIRMNVTGGTVAYLVFRQNQDESFPKFNTVNLDRLPNAIPIPLQETAGFHTYTLDINDILMTLEAKKHSQPLTQIGLVFPALKTNQDRHIFIDYIDAVPSTSDGRERASRLTQLNIPPLETIKQQIRQSIAERAPEFDVPYAMLPTKESQLSDTSVKLVEISQKNPEPATVTDNRFSLIDTGNFVVNDDEIATLEYGKRYTYQIEFTDRKKRTSELSGSVTVNFTRTPKSPENVIATPGDETIIVTWERPVFTKDATKIHTLNSYNIFRSEQPGNYPEAPIAKVSADVTTYTDTNLSNGQRYYYALQSVTSATSDLQKRELSEEASATPLDDVPPAFPTGVVGVYLGDVVNLYWDQPPTKDLAGFNVYRSEHAEGEFVKINTQPVLKASYQDTTVKKRKRYYYRITAFDDEVSANESEPSASASVDTIPLD